MNLTKWDKRFLQLAWYISTWSKDPRGGVGAILVWPPNDFISLGFNGFPRGADDNRLDLYGQRFVLHAEENAITRARRDLTGATLYVRPLPPCLGCTARILQNQIKRVVTQFQFRDLTAEQEREHAESKRQLQEAGVELLHYYT